MASPSVQKAATPTTTFRSNSPPRPTATSTTPKLRPKRVRADAGNGREDTGYAYVFETEKHLACDQRFLRALRRAVGMYEQGRRARPIHRRHQERTWWPR